MAAARVFQFSFIMPIKIDIDDLSKPDVIALLQAHLDFTAILSPPKSIHALDLAGLAVPEITFWTARLDNQLLGCVALKDIGEYQGEIKSMHTAKIARGKGVAKSLLLHVITTAQSRSFQTLFLETGSADGFTPARNLYQSHSFEVCPPFGDYVEDPHSVFMKKQL